MTMMYGITLDGVLLEKFVTPDEAYEAGMHAYEATGEFHGVVMVHPAALTITEL